MAKKRETKENKRQEGDFYGDNDDDEDNHHHGYDYDNDNIFYVDNGDEHKRIKKINDNQADDDGEIGGMVMMVR